MSDRLLAFPYYGGKYSHLGWLLPLLPACHHYVEPFGGSAAVLLNRRPAEVETYNDLDSSVVTFFRVLRDQPDELIRQLTLTPVSREEFWAAQSGDEGQADLEVARRFFIRACQSIASNAAGGNPTSWRFRRAIGRDRDGPYSGTTAQWERCVDRLSSVADRFASVQIEHRDALEVIARCDTRETLFYCDPPYVHGSRVSKAVYAAEMTDGQHEALAEALHSVQGMVALSGYSCPLYEALYRGWHRTVTPIYCHAADDRRVEVLWTNYDPAIAAHGQTRLPLEEETA